MSGTNQSISKKNGSNNSSMTNTPASTPITTMANGQTTTQTSPPPSNNAPKYGTLVPNRIFVGGISASTTESELLQLFSNYGTVKAAKIIQDRAGVSKGYGFITFESEDDAKRLQREADNIVLRERKLNIAPAIKKQPFSRAFDASSPPAVAQGSPQYFFQPGAMPYFQGGVAYYPQPQAGPTDPSNQQPAVYQPQSVYPQQSAPPQTPAYPPVMFPAQPIYMPQQYPIHVPYEYSYYPNGGAQYMVGGQGGPQSQVPPMQRPNSPPRPPCYGQQLPYTNPPDVYYNLPIYGPVDGAMYADTTGMDMSMSNGALPEEPFPIGDGVQDASEVSHTISQTNNGIHAKDAGLESKMLDTVHTENSRQSNTPVVSVLALDQHQEKDLVSMQSGRRRKLVPNTQQLQYPQHTSYTYMNYTSPPNYGSYMPPPVPQSFNGNFNYHSCMTSNVPSKTPPSMNGYENGWPKKWRNHERKSTDNCSLSSIRTDSNSSASIVDENRNEDKHAGIAHASPPLSVHHQFSMNMNKFYNSRNFQNSQSRPIARTHLGQRTTFNNSGRNGFNSSSSSHNRGKSQDGATTPKPFTVPNSYTKPSPLPQMHASNQHFVPPTRRNRRTVRRNGSTSLSEIGAGDAPLPATDVSEACNKLDSLKL